MHRIATNMWREEDAVLSFEWTMVLTLVCFGIVGGLVAARDAVIDELGDVAQAMQALDGSFSIDFPLAFTINDTASGGPIYESGGGSDSGYTDFMLFTDCDRAAAPSGQAPAIGVDSPS
ncbi:hypothetical protein NA78x_005287 [Anatilimnocola sp. NA78]|uniref:hypothetical protein n=1 Tax=Anatilimnocola sp. NA78 TaxID=3415683 RepID=UPI003CE52FB7